MQITLPASIESIATRSDNTIKIVIGTQELPPNEAAILFQIKGSEGWILFSNEYITEPLKDMPELPQMDGKSKGQRLRAVLFKVWETNTDKKKDFENFYNEQMERIIDRFKESII